MAFDCHIDKHSLEEGYLDVREDKTETKWALFGYDDSGAISLQKSGKEYNEFLNELNDSSRAYGFVRVETGDELSKRVKFAFITWIGSSVSPMKKAKVSTDKAHVKRIVQNFGKEILADDKNELQFDKVKAMLEHASGTNYGTGQ